MDTNHFAPDPHEKNPHRLLSEGLFFFLNFNFS